MKNYNRYKSISSEQYEKKGIMYYLCRKPSDKKIFSIIEKIKNKKVLEVGIGTGYYTKTFLKNKCDVTGVDINPHLGRNLGIKIVKAKADDFSKKFRNEKFDVVASFWMTEYLNEEQLEGFLRESKNVLKKKGVLITTIISNKGLGWIYTFLAKKIKGIDKYGYSEMKIKSCLKEKSFDDNGMIKLNSWLGISWACFITTE